MIEFLILVLSILAGLLVGLCIKELWELGTRDDD